MATGMRRPDEPYMEHAMSQYLAFASAVLTGLLLVSTAAAVETLTITADQAIVRAKPGITNPVLTVVPQGAILPVLRHRRSGTRFSSKMGVRGGSLVRLDVWSRRKES